MGALTPYNNVLLFNVVLQYVFPGDVDLYTFLLYPYFIFIFFLFLTGRACCLVLGIETEPQILELSRIYRDVSVILVVSDDLVRDSFNENMKYISLFNRYIICTSTNPMSLLAPLNVAGFVLEIMLYF